MLPLFSPGSPDVAAPSPAAGRRDGGGAAGSQDEGGDAAKPARPFCDAADPPRPRRRALAVAGEFPGRPCSFSAQSGRRIVPRARVEETMAIGHRIPIRRLHGPCRPGGHAQPGPPRALPFSFCFSSFFFSARVAILLGRPVSHTARPKTFPAQIFV
jgi:hypothetical protein